MDQAAGAPSAEEIARVQDYLRNQRCAEAHHPPCISITTYADPVGRLICNCGKVTWVGVVND